MFCSLFCNVTKTEAVKRSAVEDVSDEQEVVEKLVTTGGIPFPHLKYLNQPSIPCDDDTSISEESLFEPIMEVEQNVVSETRELVPFDEPNPTTPKSPCPQQNQQQQQEQQQQQLDLETTTVPAMEQAVQGTKDEFIVALEKIEKENAWHEKRQAKKAATKKKNRRNKKKNKNKQQTNSSGLQESSCSVIRTPLSSRN